MCRWGVFVCVAGCVGVRIVPYPVAGDVTRFTPEVDTLDRELRPVGSTNDQLHEDAVSAALQDIMLKAAAQRAALEAQAELEREQATAATSRSSIKDAASLREIAAGAYGSGYGALEDVLGAFFSRCYRVAMYLGLAVFTVGLVDYSAWEMIGGLNAIFAAFYVLWILTGLAFTAAVAYSSQFAWLSRGYWLFPFLAAVAGFAAYKVQQHPKPRYWLGHLSVLAGLTLALQIVPLYNSTFLSVFGPVSLAAIVPLIADRMCAFADAKILIRGLEAALTTTTGLFGTLAPWSGLMMIYDPLRSWSPAYLRAFGWPKGWVVWTETLCLYLLVGALSAALQIYRDYQRKSQSTGESLPLIS